jgi:Cof subfamily protein (haloacid dehalogenase superfamily)
MMARDVALLLADVDGTLVTDDKALTEEAKRAVGAMRAAGIRLALTSGRPPRGIRMLTAPLAIDTPIAGFNGGVMVEPDLETVVVSHRLARDDARRAVSLMEEHGLDPWVYTSKRWLIRDPKAAHVDKEAGTVQFDADVVEDFDDDALADAVKITGVTDDRDRMAKCHEAAQGAFHSDVTADLSQPYYLDVTHRRANKGEVVIELAQRLRIPERRIATIGDMPNDIAMFERSGFSIAMGHSSGEVKEAASAVTDSNEENGFAKAIWRFILEREAA